MKRRINICMSVLALLTCLLTFLGMLGVNYRSALGRMEIETSRQAALVAAGLEETSDQPQGERMEYLTAVGKSDRSRVTLINEHGEVIFDSNFDPDEMENHLERSEVKEAMEGGEGASTRVSTTLGHQTYYAALELSTGEILRVSNTTDIVAGDIQRVLPLLLLIVLVMGVLSMWLARKLTEGLVAPINTLNLEKPLENNIYEEFSPLLGKIYTQNAQIEQQIAIIRRKQIEFNAITSNMPEGLIVLDDKLQILSANSAAIRLSDAEDREWRGENLIVFSRNATLGKKARAAIAGKKDSFACENKAGAHLQIYLSPVDAENDVRGCVVLIVDVSERYAAERSRREFTANVSHELKTPLTSISGYAEMVTMGMVKADDVQGFAQKIHDEAGSLISLVDDIMKLSRLDESMSVTLPFEQVELYALAHEIIQRLHQTADSHEVTLSLAGTPVTIYGVRHMISEAIFNLCDNAIKYNRAGGKVGVCVEMLSLGARITVSDDGMGIAEADRVHIFERFYRADKSHSRTIGGTGLGLAIVKHVCEIHGAVVQVESTMEQGSVFIITFPYDAVIIA